MAKIFFITISIAFLLNCCYKEEIKNQPRILSYELSNTKENPGGTCTISVIANDDDGDKSIIPGKEGVIEELQSITFL